MSRENVEVVRNLQPTGVDLALVFRDEQTATALTEAATPFFHADFESAFVMPAERSSHTGFDGLRTAWIDWLTPWESYRTEIEELIDLDDRVAVLTRDFGRREGVEPEVSFRGVAVYVFSDGKISRIEFHFDREEGLEAVGLRE